RRCRDPAAPGRRSGRPRNDRPDPRRRDALRAAWGATGEPGRAGRAGRRGRAAGRGLARRPGSESRGGDAAGGHRAGRGPECDELGGIGVDIGQLVARSASRYATRIAVRGPQGTQTYAEFGDRVIRLANALLGLGFQPGDRVLDLQPNQNSSIEMDLACCTSGLVRVVLNYRLHPDDWARIADDCGAVGMVYDGRYAEPSTALRSE